MSWFLCSGLLSFFFLNQLCDTPYYAVPCTSPPHFRSGKAFQDWRWDADEMQTSRGSQRVGVVIWMSCLQFNAAQSASHLAWTKIRVPDVPGQVEWISASVPFQTKNTLGWSMLCTIFDHWIVNPFLWTFPQMRFLPRSLPSLPLLPVPSTLPTRALPRLWLQGGSLPCCQVDERPSRWGSHSWRLVRENCWFRWGVLKRCACALGMLSLNKSFLSRSLTNG